LSNTTSVVIKDDTRSLYRVKANLEWYLRENGRFANYENVSEIIANLDASIPRMEREGKTAKRYEDWIDGRNQYVYVVYKIRKGSDNKLLRKIALKTLATYDKAVAYKSEIRKEDKYIYDIEEMPIE